MSEATIEFKEGISAIPKILLVPLRNLRCNCQYFYSLFQAFLFYFFARCFSRRAPTNWTPGRGSYSYRAADIKIVWFKWVIPRHSVSSIYSLEQVTNCGSQPCLLFAVKHNCFLFVLQNSRKFCLHIFQLLVSLQLALKCNKRKIKRRVFASWLFLKLEKMPLTDSSAKLEEEYQETK